MSTDDRASTMRLSGSKLNASGESTRRSSGARPSRDARSCCGRSPRYGRWRIRGLRHRQQSTDRSRPLGSVGLDWQLGGFAPTVSGTFMDISNDQLVQAKLAFGGGSGAADGLMLASSMPASGWNVDRQKHDYEDQDRIKRDFRNVETPTPPLLYSLLVHGRSPSVVNRSTDLHTISVPPNSFAGPRQSRKCSESLPGPPVYRWRNSGPQQK
jgi:hypothetical protein